MGKQKLWTKDFINISLSNFFVFLTFYYLLVTLPVYSLNELHTTKLEAGLVVTVFLFSAIIIRPFAGQWIEAKGKRKILLLSLFIFMGGSFFYFIPDSIISLLVLRFLHGIGFGMATTAAGAIVADLIPESRKGEGMGYFVMSTNLAMVIGPFVGLTALNKAGIYLVFIISVFCAVLAFITGCFINNPKLIQTVVRQGTLSIKKKLTIQDLIEVSALRIAIVSAFLGFIYASILSFVSVFAQEINLLEVSSFFFVVYAVILILSRPFTGKWFDLYGANKIIYPAIICFAVGMAVLGISKSALVFLIAAALIGLGWGTLFPSFQTIAIQNAAPNRRGTATATFLSIYDLGVGIGSSLVGMISAKIGLGSFYLYSSVYVLIGIILYYFIHDKNTRLLLKEKRTEVPSQNAG
ncbi:MFS transporter [Fredinandcohnia quinoae]|uniref:MFS transporter n=1 Tax=Fredinandcohnia quinoae TaxID=2918902 RepID=A0AAW5EFP9_9BACI|nr:MFS transporter [Fredinandcohnia sp. SECRCQ15]MCH1627654.1 MFS transporter [Fredinandcohnia sp. SECRCQ15]